MTVNAMALSPVRVNPVLPHPHERRVSLNDDWRFRLDPEDRGLADRWFEGTGNQGDPIAVPGCWQGQGFGGEGTDTVWDFRLEGRVFRATYKGTGWYTRMFQAPAGWQGSRLWLNFGGAHPSADVWLNNVRLGENQLPFAPFGFEVTDLIQPDKPNRLAVRVHEAHREFGLSFSFQGNWSGLYRGVELTATGPRFIEWCNIYPDVDSSSLRLRVRVGSGPVPSGALSLAVAVSPADGPTTPMTTEHPVKSAEEEFVLPVPSPRLWSPDSPNLYRVDVALRQGPAVLDAQSERVGFVKLSVDGSRFLVNGEPYYMRGTADFVACPETGCPDTDRERWRRKLKTLRAYGYNYVRCQSYVYNPEYFDIADEVGLLIQSEMGMLGAWGGTSPSHVYQWPKPTPGNYPILKRQWDIVVQRDVNHPSANLYCMSNEYTAGCDFHRVAWQCYHDTKAVKPTALVIWTDGGYHRDLPGDFVNVFASACPSDIKGDPSVIDTCGKPVIEHECRWWSAFPDVRLASKYTGAVRPYGAEMARAAAERRGQGHLLEAYADASQRLQFAESKAKMEAIRRDGAKLAGICHFNAMDSNPSPQGVVDEFYERKLASSERWVETNGDTVVLSSLGFEDRVWGAGETLRVKLLVSDFSHPPMRAPTVAWRLVADDRVLASGEVRYAHQPFCTCAVGEVQVAIPDRAHPAAARLEVRLQEGTRVVTNAWSVWLIPAPPAFPSSLRCVTPAPYTWLKDWASLLPARAEARSSYPSSGVVLTERVDAALVTFMQAGGRAILVAGEGLVRPHPPLFGYVKYFFTPPANYSPYEDGQNGSLIARHPMLGDFPHDGFADLQFFRMVDDAPPLDLEPLDLHGDSPVIRVIHRYPVLHPLGYLLERKVGRGGLIVCALKLTPSWPEARYLLAQIVAYANGEAFHPATVLSDRARDGLMRGTALP
jgi:beta-galactosidase